MQTDFLAPPPGPLEHALLHARWGWHVLPVFEIGDDGRCTCGLAKCAAGKHPVSDLAPHGVDDATTDVGIIREWWRRRPSASVGIRTGSISGIVVIDIDPKNDGLESWKILESECDVPQSYVVETGLSPVDSPGLGRRGFHVYLRAQPGVPVKSRRLHHKLKGIDIRGDGSYVVAPPSRHVSGVRYEPKEGPLCHFDPSPAVGPPTLDEPVGRLLELLVRGEEKEGTGTNHTLDGALGRNDWLANRLAIPMRKAGLDGAQILEQIALANSRLAVPLDLTELRTIANSAARYEPGDPVLSHPDALVEAFRLPPAALGDEWPLGIVEYLSVDPPAEGDADFWCMGLVPKNAPWVIAGPPKSSKSFVQLDLAVSIALGVDWLGQFRVGHRGRVLIISLEDNISTTRRRLWQMLRGRGVAPQELEGWLEVVSDVPYHWLDAGNGEQLKRAVDRFKPDVLMVDSFAEAATGIEENSRKEVSEIFARWKQMVRDWGISVGATHHYTKGRYEGTSEKTIGQRLRGSGSFFGFVRQVVGVERAAEFPGTVSAIETVGNYETQVSRFLCEVKTTGAEGWDEKRATTLLYLGAEGEVPRAPRMDVVEYLREKPRKAFAVSRRFSMGKGEVGGVLANLETAGLAHEDKGLWYAG